MKDAYYFDKNGNELMEDDFVYFNTEFKQNMIGKFKHPTSVERWVEPNLPKFAVYGADGIWYYRSLLTLRKMPITEWVLLKFES